MNGTDAGDPALRALSALQPLAPDRERAHRVRMRCREALQRRRRRRRVAALRPRVLAAAAIASACAVYIASLLATLVSLYVALP